MYLCKLSGECNLFSTLFFPMSGKCITNYMDIQLVTNDLYYVAGKVHTNASKGISMINEGLPDFLLTYIPIITALYQHHEL